MLKRLFNNKIFRNFTNVSATLAVLAFADALFGGGISASLWPTRMLANVQDANDFYQMFFGLVTVVSLIFLYRLFEWRVWLIVLGLINYVEDMLYYLFLPLTKPIISFLTDGRAVVNTDLPEQIGGWIGWVARRFDYSFAMPIETVVLLNILWLVFTIVFLLKVEDDNKRRFDPDYPAVQ